MKRETNAPKRRLVTRIAFSFAILLLLSVATAAVGAVGTQQVNGLLQEVINRDMLPVLYIEEIRTAQSDLANMVQDGLWRNDSVTLQYIASAYLAETDQTVQFSVTKLKALLPEGEKSKLLELQRLWNQERDAVSFVVAFGRKGSIAAAIDLSNTKIKKLRFLEQGILQTLLDSHRRDAVGSNSAADLVLRQVARLLWAFLLAALAVGATFSILVSRAIMVPIDNLLDGTRKVAAGDLTRRLNMRSGDEIGLLGKAFDDMTDNLQRLVANMTGASRRMRHGSLQLRDSAEEVNKETAELGQAMTDIAQRAEERTRQLEEAMAKVSEMSDHATNLSQRSRSMLDAAHEAEQAADTGHRVSMDVIARSHHLAGLTDITFEQVSALGELLDSVDQIVATVRSVSEQAQLLALNAQIEATRAGEDGYGFTVIASSVSQLSSRVHEAMESIRELIEDVRKRVEAIEAATRAGLEEAKHSGQSAESMEGPVAAVRHTGGEVRRLVDEVAAGLAALSLNGKATAENIAHVNKRTLEDHAAIARTRDISRTQIAMVQEVTSLADVLARMGNDLNDSVSVFRTNEKEAVQSFVARSDLSGAHV